MKINSYHEAGIEKFELIDNILKVKVELIDDEDQEQKALIVFDGVKNIKTNDSNKFISPSEGFDDGEILRLKISSNNAILLIEWTNFKKNISETLCYEFYFAKYEEYIDDADLKKYENLKPYS